MLHLVIAVIGSVVVIVMDLFFAKVANYRLAPLFLVPLIWIPCLLRRRLDLTLPEYALLVAAVLLHNCGALGWYQHFPLGFSFDIVVHFFFAFVASFPIHRLLCRRVFLKLWPANLFTVVTVMGCGALHEVMEFATTLLGEGRAMLNKKESYIYDTERDLTCNLVGVIVALLLINVWRRLNRRDGASHAAGRSQAG